MPKTIGGGSLLVVLLVAAACNGPASTASQGPSNATSSSAAATASASAAATATAVPTPTEFASATYGYTVTLAAGWTSIQASSAWDGTSGLSSTSAEVDQFKGPTTAISSSGVGAATVQTLAEYTDALIAATAQFHGDTCPSPPESQDPITIGGDPGVLVAFDCGILINNALVIHNAIGYQFLLRDLSVHASTDAADRALFITMLESVQFPS